MKTFESTNLNVTNLLKFIHYNNGATKFEIAEKIGVSPAALTKMSKKLLNEKVILEKIVAEKNERKKTLMVINYDSFISIGGIFKENNLNVNIANLKNESLHKFKIAFDSNGTFEENVHTLFESIKIELFKKEFTQKILGLGFAFPTELLMGKGKSYLREQKVKILEEMTAEYFDAPLFLESDIRALALWKSFSNPEYENFYLIKYSDYRGVATIINNALLRPVIPHNRSIGIKHIILDPDSKIFCDVCKKRGCLETLIAPKYLYNILLENYKKEELDITLKDFIPKLIERAEEGKIIELGLIRKIAKYLAMLIVNYNTIHSLDKFLVSGEIFKSQLFLKYLKMYLQEFQLEESLEEIIYIPEEDDDELHASSFLAINYIFYNYNLK